MKHAVLPFNWAQVRAYVNGTRFPYTPDTFLLPEDHEFECSMVLPTIVSMISIRGWLQDQIPEGYEKFGRFIITAGRGDRIDLECIGMSFVFKNVVDLNYFRLSCHTGLCVDPI